MGEVGPGTEPLLYAATSPSVMSGGYYGPRGSLGLVGPTTLVRPHAGLVTPRPEPGCGPQPGN